MGKVLDCIGDQDVEFIEKQKVFFVATAPLSKDHHVNVSPKSPGSSLVILDPHKVAYLDLTGSGSESAAHVLENGRMTILFCNLEEGPPKILRLHGTAKVVLREDADTDLLSKFPTDLTSSPGFRAVFVVQLNRVSLSCGFSMPVMKFESYRQILKNKTEGQGRQKMLDYNIKMNSFSIDGMLSIGVLRTEREQAGYRIMRKPTDGYVYGVKVPKNSLGSVMEDLKNKVQSQLKFDLYGFSMLLLGAALATLFQWSWQQQCTEQSAEL
eukprot:scaffold343_cov94-Cylindrotheca_fusiformis.AAC.5